MKKEEQEQFNTIIKLLEASEFIMCAIRALSGSDSQQARSCIEFALSKIAEASNMKLKIKQKAVIAP
ncbi:hypothetical protein [uncultured Bartonella sp.]|uniref:hypothetical protein n=1 Tax=uncultured Bartonella sp. TaxID=104108 RepID=UPI002603A0B7|nr:hypothetical protein [uncultured Bartonella sp.]